MEWIAELQETTGSQLAALLHHNWMLLAVITLAAVAWYFAASDGAPFIESEDDPPDFDGDE